MLRTQKLRAGPVRRYSVSRAPFDHVKRLAVKDQAPVVQPSGHLIAAKNLLRVSRVSLVLGERFAAIAEPSESGFTRNPTKAMERG